MQKTGELTIGERLGDAVHQHKALSVDGILERLFSRAFHGLVYPQIWEDPVVDMQAMAIEPHHEIICIASGSCNALSYLTANPNRVMAVDLSPAHVALGRLKAAAFKHLADQDAVNTFLINAASPENISNYDRYIAAHLDTKTRAYWEKRNVLGRRRISMFRRGFYSFGLLGRSISTLHFVSRIYGRDLTRYLGCKTIDEQKAFFDREIAPLYEKRIVRFITSHRASLFGLGIPPAQFELLAGPEGNMAAVLKERTHKLACDFPLSQNYFARQAFGRGYGKVKTHALPPCLDAENFESVKANIDRYSVENVNLIEMLRARPAHSVHRFVLLDAQDWMTDVQLNQLWTEITRTAADDARVICRTAGKPTILPGRVRDDIMAQWHYQEAASLEYSKADRSAIYGGFHLYEKRN
jgi:S-adenosylmethionine-diacylglycerol 3-amino-3-carboxypropyl transferase